MARTLDNQIEWEARLRCYQIVRNGRRTSLYGMSNEQAQERLHGFMDSVSSFHFCSREGYDATIRKERVQRGGDYWRAAKRVDGKVQKRHVGKTASVTFESLEHVVQQFAQGNSKEQERAKERRHEQRMRAKPDFKRRFKSRVEQHAEAEQPRKKRKIEDVLRERREQAAQAEAASQTERPRRRTREEALREQREKRAREQAERDRQAQETAERERQEQARRQAEADAAFDAAFEAAYQEQQARREQARQQEKRRQQHTHDFVDFGTFCARLDALETMGFDDMPSASDLKRRHRDLAKKHHPDKGGDTAMMAKINAANDLLKKCVAA